MNIIECLMQTGLTRHESTLYITLCKKGELNGYEAAKIANIPRANTYQALAGLVDKGAAFTIESTNGIRYTAVPVNDYCANILNRTTEILEKIKLECPTIKAKSEPYITIQGFEHIINKMKNIINNAAQRIYISISANDLNYLKDDLESAADRGLKVVAITYGNFDLKNITVYTIKSINRHIRLIADSSDVLTGNISGSQDDTCLFSKNMPLVELIKDSLKNEIKLAQLERSV